MTQRKCSETEEVAIQNTFDSYIKKTIDRSAMRAICNQVKEKAEPVEEPEQLKGEGALIYFDYADCIEVKQHAIPITNEKLYGDLGVLNERERQIILLNVCEQLPLKMVAKILDMDYGCARVYKIRGLKKLREMIKKYGL